MSHTITVTRLAGDTWDDADYEVAGTCDYRCEVEDSDECGLKYCYGLNLEVEKVTELGTYAVEVEWDGDDWLAWPGEPVRSSPDFGSNS